MIAIRGATTIHENNVDEIKAASVELFDKIIEANNLDLNEITAIIFSCTKDITKDYPGKFIREHFRLNSTAIMHFNEMEVENALELCIRIMLFVNRSEKHNIRYVYLNEAKILRRDLLK